MTASIIIIAADRRIDSPWFVRQASPPANENLRFRLIDNLKTGAPEHRRGAGAIGNPPVGGISGVTLLDEIHFGVAGLIEDVCLPEIIVIADRGNFFTAALHRLEDEQVAHDVLLNQV